MLAHRSVLWHSPAWRLDVRSRLTSTDMNQRPPTLTGDSRGLHQNLDQTLNVSTALKSAECKSIDIWSRRHTKAYLPLIMFAIGSHFFFKGS